MKVETLQSLYGNKTRYHIKMALFCLFNFCRIHSSLKQFQLSCVLKNSITNFLIVLSNIIIYYKIWIEHVKGIDCHLIYLTKLTTGTTGSP